MVCPNCGAQIEDGAEFCPECGAMLESSQTFQEATLTEQPVEAVPELKKSKTPKIIAAVLAAIIALGAVCFACYSFIPGFRGFINGIFGINNANGEDLLEAFANTIDAVGDLPTELTHIKADGIRTSGANVSLDGSIEYMGSSIGIDGEMAFQFGDDLRSSVLYVTADVDSGAAVMDVDMAASEGSLAARTAGRYVYVDDYISLLNQSFDYTVDFNDIISDGKLNGAFYEEMLKSAGGENSLGGTSLFYDAEALKKTLSNAGKGLKERLSDEKVSAEYVVEKNVKGGSYEYTIDGNKLCLAFLEYAKECMENGDNDFNAILEIANICLDEDKKITTENIDNIMNEIKNGEKLTLYISAKVNGDNLVETADIRLAGEKEDEIQLKLDVKSDKGIVSMINAIAYENGACIGNALVDVEHSKGREISSFELSLLDGDGKQRLKLPVSFSRSGDTLSIKADVFAADEDPITISGEITDGTLNRIQADGAVNGSSFSLDMVMNMENQLLKDARIDIEAEGINFDLSFQAANHDRPQIDTRLIDALMESARQKGSTV